MNKSPLTAKASSRIRRPPADVFRAFADANEMSRFWFTRHDDGLRRGESVKWFIGSDEDAIAFDVRVKELIAPEKIVIEWSGFDGAATQVIWTFEETADRHTILSIEESGFQGTAEEITERALDSCGGFNQVIVAAKALVEHGVEINVVADHV